MNRNDVRVLAIGGLPRARVVRRVCSYDYNLNIFESCPETGLLKFDKG